MVLTDKIFRGAEATHLPFMLVDRLTLAVNLSAAKSLGITFPQSVLDRADRINK